MADKPHENIDCSFFNDIINGHLRPFLTIYDIPDELKKLNSIVIDNLTVDQIRDCLDKPLPEEIIEKFNIRDGDNIKISITDEKEIVLSLSNPENDLEPLIDIDIPPTIDDKSEAFLILIEREFENMKIKAQKVLKASKNDNQLSFYANKNIQSLKNIAQQAGKLYKQLLDSDKNPSNDSNTYILHIVKVFLIRAIMFYQENFEPFLKEVPEDYYNLKTILFGDKHPSEISKLLETKYKSLYYTCISDIFDYINSGIMQVELFIKGSITEIQFHNLTGAFEKLFQEIIKVENFNNANLSLIDKYYDIFDDIIYNDELGAYEENLDIENKFFKRMMAQIYQSIELIEKFGVKHGLERDDHKHSIFDILLKKETASGKQIIKETKVIPDAFTYKSYNSNLSAISDALDCLKKNKFVAPDTDLKDFRKIFNNTTPDKPIRWIGNISELSYFIKVLHNDYKLITDLKGNIWKVTAKLFLDSNCTPFESQRFRGQKNPARAELLEKAANHLN